MVNLKDNLSRSWWGQGPLSQWRCWLSRLLFNLQNTLSPELVLILISINTFKGAFKNTLSPKLVGSGTVIPVTLLTKPFFNVKNTFSPDLVGSGAAVSVVSVSFSAFFSFRAWICISCHALYRPAWGRWGTNKYLKYDYDS